MSPELESLPLAEIERLAERVADPAAWNYLVSGAGTEDALRENLAAFRRIRFAPRVCTDVSDVDTGLLLLGLDLPHPVLIGPTACHRMFHPDGEEATARGAGDAGAVFCLSGYSTTGMAAIQRAASGPWWLQYNAAPDDGFTRELIAEATERGAAGIVLTVDTPVAGARERQGWDGVSLPDGLSFALTESAPYPVRPPSSPYGIHRPALDASFTWERLAGLRASTRIPLLVKGILRADDALRCLDAGADGIIVSNHGARNLDSVLSTAEALPRVAEAVRGRAAVLVDGGLRRGADIAKALALGADAVLLGRPALHGLVLAGAQGVGHVVRRLRYELAMTMALCGAPDLAALDVDLLV
ncbi:alpha-hydroxy acid oxidase [Sciscionella marina]|uniref:alpha-hydroxy acid oxidase n=1 Tax=Sciscionella marina TaxID=508770 RepID=UPI00037BD24D|nr:alpha-hydroxy acid oxidase [Sciscionella marina]